MTWNRVNRKPFAARRSSVGVGTSPPNVDVWPYPVSSSRITTTFGAPGGAVTPGLG